MSPLEAIKQLEANEYRTEDGDVFRFTLLPSLSDEEIETFRKTLSRQHLPEEIRELLEYTTGLDGGFVEGFNFHQLTEWSWDDRLFPNSVYIGTDGRGNQWVVDVDSAGNWGPVYFIDHDPPVVMRFADSLANFLMLFHQDGKDPDRSEFNRLYGPVESAIYDAGENPVPTGDLGYDLSRVPGLPKMYRVESLEDESTIGFVWALGGNDNFIYRLPDRPVWIIEVQEAKDFWGRKNPGVPARRRVGPLEWLLKLILK